MRTAPIWFYVEGHDFLRTSGPAPEPSRLPATRWRALAWTGPAPWQGRSHRERNKHPVSPTCLETARQNSSKTRNFCRGESNHGGKKTAILRKTEICQWPDCGSRVYATSLLAQSCRGRFSFRAPVRFQNNTRLTHRFGGKFATCIANEYIFGHNLSGNFLARTNSKFAHRWQVAWNKLQKYK